VTVTPDGRYFVARGRLCRTANLSLDDGPAALFTCFGKSLLAA
jgi:hypothetical protein